ncbi:MAG: hypothetical protein LUH05_04150 [Candidatus Gastranaerophilales bacterium]|nr:hypothetical protein [Candidatus Gastranaerophilales bacterium]
MIKGDLIQDLEALKEEYTYRMSQISSKTYKKGYTRRRAEIRYGYYETAYKQLKNLLKAIALKKIEVKTDE